MLRLVLSAFVFLAFCVPALAQNSPDYPQDSQINLLLARAERAFEVYEDAVKLEKLHFVGEAAESVRRDQDALYAGRSLLAKLKGTPQLFNSPLGFIFVTMLDDASRSMAICVGQAGILAANQMTAGEAAAANSKLAVAQGCQKASDLLFTVSQSAAVMYRDYLISSQHLQDQMFEIAQRCAGVLKNNPLKTQ
jgi:hypothetical protein